MSRGKVFDFRQQQEQSRRGTLLLVLLFLVMVAVIGLAVGLLVSILVADQMDSRTAVQPDYGIALAAAAAAMAVMAGAALYKLWSLGGDGARVAQSLGAEEVLEDTQNAYKRRYLNIIDEMAIAAGQPRPRAFVLKHEQGINAFAAGDRPERAAIGVTHGALSKLNREELAGVVAHEMAHIANHDTRLNMRLMGLVFGLVVLSVVGRSIMRGGAMQRRGGRGNRGGGSAIVLVGFGLIVLGYLGVLGGRILQSTVSRQREYLADATGVQFTRDPTGLANALKKIAATAAGSGVGNAHAEETRHMFFAQATGSFAGLFATHPSLNERISALDPQFDPATDPILAKDDRTILRETRSQLAGPWG